ncbi:transmembrane protein 11, mitochondrial [Halyomorpha halys]|uniref:transmembrane protein 11, mitochondrial n=1 Tax=Halyomorpha halys TaxID=286706 RepID=UPI0006D4F556|nr:transmembrane protein 11, mitochondrial [Halyomorpha halys]
MSINESEQSETAVIKEIYDSENAHEAFVDELERALEAGCKFIIIEPPRLGDETARWIAVGNCLHKTAVISGVSAIICGFIWPKYPYSYMPFGVISFFTTGLYTVSWQFDPCVKYQVYTDSQRLARLPFFNTITSASPTVLVRKDDRNRKILHCTVMLASSILCAWRLCKLFNN